MGTRLVLEGFRQAGQGFQALGQGLQQRQLREERLRETEARREAERLLQERLQRASDTVGEITTAAQDPEFGRTQFAESSRPVIETAIQTQNPALLRALDPVEQIIKSREQAAREAEEREKDIDVARITAGQAAQAEQSKLKREQKRDLRQLRKDFTGSATTKTTRDLESSFGKIKKASQAKASAANDIALVFNFMKMNDPGSVVRESEFRTAAGARSFFSDFVTEQEDGSGVAERDGVAIPIPGFVMQAFQRIDPDKKGAFLLPEQREDFADASEIIFRDQLSRQVVEENDTRALARDFGVDPTLVIGSRTAEDKLADLNKAKEKRDQARAAKRQAEGRESGVLSEVEGKAGSVKVIDQGIFDKIQNNPKNVEAFQQLIGQENQERAAQGLPPLTPEEENIRINAVLEANGLKLQGE